MSGNKVEVQVVKKDGGEYETHAVKDRLNVASTEIIKQIGDAKPDIELPPAS